MKLILHVIWSEILYLGHNLQFKVNIFVWFVANILVWIEVISHNWRDFFLPYVNFSRDKKRTFYHTIWREFLVRYEIETSHLKRKFRMEADFFVRYEVTFRMIWNDIPKYKVKFHTWSEFLVRNRINRKLNVGLRANILVRYEAKFPILIEFSVRFDSNLLCDFK